MSFRKRNVVVSSPKNISETSRDFERVVIQGVRTSLLDGRLTTSTGTRSLDATLTGHAGLAMGTSLLIEESGTSDFGGILLRYFAAEGIAQGHQVHVLGMNESWGRDLPGITGTKECTLSHDDGKRVAVDRMKIAWRYERLGEFGRDKAPVPSASVNVTNPQVFCHDFDLGKRLVLPSPSPLNYILQVPKASPSFDTAGKADSVFSGFLSSLASHLSTAPKASIHRIVIPGLLSPAIYASTATVPENLLQFLHSLRALLRKYPLQLTALITLPLALHPRGTGLTRWAEILSDGVIELTPFPTHINSAPRASPAQMTGQDEMPQGMLRVHRLPILHERGGTGDPSGLVDDLAFTLSKRKGLVIKPFSLPPVGGDTDTQHTVIESNSRGASRLDIEF